MVKKESEQDSLVQAALALNSTLRFVREPRPEFSVSPEVVDTYLKAGRKFASQSLRILGNRELAQAFVDHGGYTDQAKLAHMDDDLTSSVYLRLTMQEEVPTFHYVVEGDTRGVHLDGRPNTHEEKFNRFNERLEGHRRIPTDKWNVSMSESDRFGLKWEGDRFFYAERGLHPEDIIDDRFLPSFVRRTIETCQKIRKGIERKSLREMGITSGESERLITLTERFTRATEILQD